jgi:hypothetical protein
MRDYQGGLGGGGQRSGAAICTASPDNDKASGAEGVRLEQVPARQNNEAATKTAAMTPWLATAALLSLGLQQDRVCLFLDIFGVGFNATAGAPQVESILILFLLPQIDIGRATFHYRRISAEYLRPCTRYVPSHYLNHGLGSWASFLPGSHSTAVENDTRI